jgi:phosphatidylglycerophosphate synthase
LADYRKMAKPREIEEVGDVYLIRPTGFLIVQLLRRTAATPTMVSALAVLAGWWTAWLYFDSNRLGNIPSISLLAFLAFLLHSALDSADGQLARLTGRHTPLGRLVDGFCDSLVFIAIYVAIVVGHWQRVGDYQVSITILGALGLVSHSIQSSLTEYQRTLYLFYVFGKRDIEESDPAHLEGVVQATGGRFARLLHALHLVYYRQQRLFLRSTLRLEAFVREWTRKHPDKTAVLQETYARNQRGIMKVLGAACPQLPQARHHHRLVSASGSRFVLDQFGNRLVPHLRPRSQPRDVLAHPAPGQDQQHDQQRAASRHRQLEPVTSRLGRAPSESGGVGLAEVP